MKTIQVTIDERLLKQLDADQEVRREGRSAVLRRAVFAYLRSRRRQTIRAEYQRAYSNKPAPDVDWIGWGNEESWPAE